MEDLNKQIAKSAEGASASDQYLTFQVNDQKLALEILRIKEIIEFDRITVVPMMQACIDGVINLRGSVVPVVNLSARFGQGKTKPGRRTCIVILESQLGEETQVVGFLVDAVNAVIDIDSDNVAPPPQFGAGIKTDFLRGIGKVDEEFVMLLNVEKLLDFHIPTDLEDMAEAAQSSTHAGNEGGQQAKESAKAEAKQTEESEF